MGQFEIGAPCLCNSIPYDYRMSQIITEVAQIVPKLAPKIMLSVKGENIICFRDGGICVKNKTLSRKPMLSTTLPL